MKPPRTTGYQPDQPGPQGPPPRGGSSAQRPEVEVAPANYAANAAMRALWIRTGAVIDGTRESMAFEAVVSVMLSRLTREMRRAYGTEHAKFVLQRFVDTMEDLAENDR